LKRLLAVALLCCAPIVAQNAALQGQWKALIEFAKDAAATEILFQFQVAADGRVEATFRIPQLGVEDVPVTAIRLEGSQVRMQLESLQAEFQGTLNADGTEVAGALTRSGQNIAMRLVLVKRTLDPRPGMKESPKEVVDWFRRAAIPLRTAEPGHGVEDMRPLRELVGKARIVALGEATHGTREFFQLKHRLLEFLVTEMGFTVFALEANWPESLALNDYVLTGKGDPIELLEGLHFWTCNSQEVLDMVRWMRRYNADAAHTNKVKFFGFDMQFTEAAASNVAAFLRRVEPEVAGRTGLKPAELVANLDRNRERYAGLTSESAWRIARQNAEILRQAADMADSAARDRFMADNVKWILDQEPAGTKIVLWAHNGHVHTGPNPGEPVPMGSHLRRMYGDEVVTLGFAFNQGSFRASVVGARRLDDFTVHPAAPDTLDGVLASTGLPLFLVDLRKSPQSGPAAAWLAQDQRSRQIGAIYSDDWERTYRRLHVTQSFDLLLFVERTSAARPAVR
jgi:erythromycin esterase